MFLFFPRNRAKEGKNRSCLGVDTSGREENIRKRSKRVNMVEILQTHV
jgi:hypothetical protein